MVNPNVVGSPAFGRFTPSESHAHARRQLVRGQVRADIRQVKKDLSASGCDESVSSVRLEKHDSASLSHLNLHKVDVRKPRSGVTARRWAAWRIPGARLARRLYARGVCVWSPRRSEKKVPVGHSRLPRPDAATGGQTDRLKGSGRQPCLLVRWAPSKPAHRRGRPFAQQARCGAAESQVTHRKLVRAAAVQRQLVRLDQLPPLGARPPPRDGRRTEHPDVGMVRLRARPTRGSCRS